MGARYLLTVRVFVTGWKCSLFDDDTATSCMSFYGLCE